MRKKNRSKNKDLLLLLAAVPRASGQGSILPLHVQPIPRLPFKSPFPSRHVTSIFAPSPSLQIPPVSLSSSHLISNPPRPPPTNDAKNSHPPIPTLEFPEPNPPGSPFHSIPFNSFSRPAYMQLSHNHPLLDLPIIACEKKSRCSVSVGGMYRKKKKKKKRSQKKKKVRVINFY